MMDGASNKETVAVLLRMKLSVLGRHRLILDQARNGKMRERKWCYKLSARLTKMALATSELK